MEEAKDRSGFKHCKDCAANLGISGVYRVCPSDLAHEMIMRPVTPFLVRENQVAPSPSCGCDEADAGFNSQTPTRSMFDPFAPGRESLMFAPKKTALKKPCDPIRRKLDFEPCCVSKQRLVSTVSEEDSEEEGNVCRSLFDVITSPCISFFDEIRVSNDSGGGTSSTEAGEDMDHSKISKAGTSSVDISCLPTGPPTPSPERKSPQVSLPSDIADGADLGPNCQTPRESTIDTFAPGPEELMFAPKKKVTKEAHLPVQRKLDFDSCCAPKHLPEGRSEEVALLEMFYRSILEAIISCQLGGSVNAGPSTDAILFDGSRTPTVAPLLNGVAETCPGAPIRPVPQSRKLDAKICRKLEF